jgi:ATP-dependent RNA/DNA helicase IGHMBP2
VIVAASITARAANAVAGAPTPYDPDPLCEDLSAGWTLSSGRGLRNSPEKLRLIGARFYYIAKLSGYRLPAGLCVCDQNPCVCAEAHQHDEDDPGELILISARERDPGDFTEREVLYGERYEDEFTPGGPLDPDVYAALCDRWTRVHARAQRPAGERLKRWRELNDLTAFLAEEQDTTIELGDPPLDEDELAEGRLVLLARSPSQAARAAPDFVYRLPRLDVPLRVEDQEDDRLLLDCGEQDPVRVHEHLRSLSPGERRLSRDAQDTSRLIERARWTLIDAERDGRLSALIEQPAIALCKPRRRAERLFNETLDEGQRHAVNAALAAEDVLIVQGPPGTGKTTFICETVRQQLERDPQATVLLAAQTHQAIDNVIKRLAKADPDLPMARVGSPYVAARMDPFVRERYWIESPEPWKPRVRLRAERYRQMAKARLRAYDTEDPQATETILEIQQEYFDSEGLQSGPAARLAAARVVAGTCHAVSGNPDVRARQFTLALLEEAGKASPAEALMLMLRSRRSILIGDSRQLPPHVWGALGDALRDPSTIKSKNHASANDARRLAKAARALGKTPLERVGAAEETLFDHFAKQLEETEHETTLTTQYRMVPAIGELVSEVFYRGALKHGRPANLADRDPRVSDFARATEVRLLDIPGRQRREHPDSRSNVRDEEIERIARELAGLQRRAELTLLPPRQERPGPLGVAVITPYAAQARRLHARLDQSAYPNLRIRIGIVDRFQGDEECVVIVSFVNTTYAGFLKTPNRINVALSRAQDLLIIATDVRAARAGRIGEPLKQVVDLIAKRAEEGDDRYELKRRRERRGA